MKTILATSTDDDPLADRRGARRLFGALIGAAMLAFIGLDWLGYPLVAVGGYWLFVLGAAAVLCRSDHVMDERDRARERRTSHRAVVAVGVALVVLGPGLGALAEAGIYDAPAVVDGVLFGWVALYAVWGVAHAWSRLRP